MALCSHQQWLRVHQEDPGFVLQYGSRLHHIAASLPRPAQQYPSLAFFVGKQFKTRALRALFPGNTITNCRKYGVANTCLHSPTRGDNYPVLLADSCPDYTQLSLRRGKDACHEVINHPVSWQNDENSQSNHQDLASHTLERLLTLFMDVLCIFAQDCGGLDGVSERLRAWAKRGSASSLAGVRPRLLVITNISGDNFASEALRFRLQVLSDPMFSESFSSLNLVNILAAGRLSPSAHFSALGEVLHGEICLARAERVNTHTLFSMVHFEAFFEAALRQFATSPSQTFDFIRCSRGESLVSPNFEHHLRAFLDLCSESKLPDNIPWEFIASAIVLDSFPPNMHSRILSQTLDLC